MPLPILDIPVTGRINRRDARDKLAKGEVLFRENMLVEGIGKDKRCKKMPGSDRYSATDLGGNYTSGYRYYTGITAETFAFNDYTKKLYFIDENGNESEVQHLPSGQVAYPVYETVRVSENNIMYISDGFNGMYSYDGNIAHTVQKETAVTLNFVDMIAHLDRLFGFEEDSDAGYFSKNLVPTNFTDSSDAGTFIIGAKRGSKLMRIIKYQNNLYWFKDDSIWILEGTTPSTFSLREVVPNLGLASRRGIAVTPTAIFFLGSDFEVYQFQGTLGSLKLMTFNIALGGDLSKDLNEIINKDRLSQVSACYHNYLFRMSFVETGETQNKLEYIFNTTNETDSFTRGNNVSCYIVYDKSIDKGKLVTGRSDGVGRLMHQYRGLNWDNQASSPTMPVKLMSAFVRGAKDKLANFRCKHLWADLQVLGALGIPVDYYLDTRLAKSTSKTVTLSAANEQKNLTNFIRTNNQTSTTSRETLHFNYAMGQSIAFAIDQNLNNQDISLSSFFIDVVEGSRKRSRYIGV